jgi:hypothetical protein
MASIGSIEKMLTAIQVFVKNWINVIEALLNIYRYSIICCWTTAFYANSGKDKIFQVPPGRKK